MARLQVELENQQNELNGREADIAKHEQSLQQKTQEAQGAILQMQNMNNDSNIQKINGVQNESNKSSDVELMPQKLT